MSHPFISQMVPLLLGSLHALSAGVLIYIGTTHLLSRAEQEPRRYSLIALAAEVVVALGIFLSKGWR